MLSVVLSLLLLFTNAFFPALHPRAPGRVAIPGAPASRIRLVHAYAQLPPSFEINHGQTDRRVQYLSRAHGYTLFLKSGEAVLALSKSEVRSQKSEVPEETRESKFETRHSSVITRHFSKTTASVLRMRLVGTNSSAQALGLDELPGKSNYLLGNDPRRWRTNIQTYGKVRYDKIYSGIDLVYYGTQGQLEYDFIVAPGADPASVRLRLSGGTPSLNPDGDLSVKVSGGEVIFRRPHAYQKTEGNASAVQSVKAEYVLSAPNRVGFRVAKYDATKTLIIDPVLSYATYLGGNQGDGALGLALDSAGDAFVTGYTASTNFPAPSSFQTAKKGGVDAFISKLNPTGDALLYSTYLGGTGDDKGTGIAVDSQGNAYVTGTTSSANFPTAPPATPAPGALQNTYGGNGDAFVAKLDPTGTKLLYSTFLGGSQADGASAIAVDASSNAYVTGSTLSTNFPTVTPFQSANGGAADAFIAKVNPAGTALVYSTYLGGAGADAGQGIAVDSTGNAYVTGYTLSTNFPTATPFQPANAGGADVFITKLSPTGSSLVYSTYLGGSNQDRGAAVAVDSAGNAYVTGDTLSSGFPVTSGAVQPVNNGNDDAFVIKLNSAGSALFYSTFLGGSGTDQGTGIAVDSTGNTFVTGFTASSNFPTANPVQATLGGGTCGSGPCADAFVAQLNPAATALVYSTYLGGNAADFGQAIAVDASGSAYVAGITSSANFPAVAGALQGAPGDTAGDGDAFVAKISNANATGISLSPQNINFGNQVINTQSAVQTVTLTNVGTAPLHVFSITATGDFSANSPNCIGTVAVSGGACTINITYTPASLPTATVQISIADDAPGSPHQITVTGTGVNAPSAVTFTPSSLAFADQSVGVTSPPQSVMIANTGTAALTITAIAATGDYTLATNDCPTTPIPVGGTCTVSVTFTPTATGARPGTISVTDNATGSPQSVSITGSGTPNFSLSTPAATAHVLIGTTSSTFTVGAAGPSSVTGSVTLSCEAGPTCAFNPTSITFGQTSTLTATIPASTLNTAPAPPLNFVVDGTNGAQTAKLPLTVSFADFTVSATPALSTIVSGQSATYTVSVAGTNGFDQAVQLTCDAANVPRGASCAFSPTSVTLSGAVSSTSQLILTTTAHAEVAPRAGSRTPHPPPKFLVVILCGLVLILVALRIASFAIPAGLRVRGSRPIPVNTLAVLALSVFLLVAAASGCSYNYEQLLFPGTTTGTLPGNFTIVIRGTTGTGSAAVSRGTNVNLAVSN